MISIQKIFGKDEVIFDLLEASAAEGLNSVKNLNRMIQSRDHQPTMEEMIKSRRKEKEITREITERLVKTLVTSIYREDLENLSDALYKVPKTVQKFAERYLIVFDLISDCDFSKQTYLLEQATQEVVEIVRALRKGQNSEVIEEINSRLQQVEGDADRLMLDLMKDLYSGKHSAIRLVALKDLYELLEKIVDRCRDAGNAVTQIVLKHS